ADAGFTVEHLLHLEDVVPIVSEVVGVRELLDPAGYHLTQFHLPLVLDVHHSVRVRLAVLLTTDLEGVQVVAIPAHAGLDNAVQLTQGAVLDLDPTPDRGLDVPERDLQLVDDAGFLGLGHRAAPHSCRLLPCFPFQNGQKGQSSPIGKSSPSSCGHPMFPWLIATCWTPCWRKKSCNSCCTFGFVVTSVATHRIKTGSAPSCEMTAAAIFVVILS